MAENMCMVLLLVSSLALLSIEEKMLDDRAI